MHAESNTVESAMPPAAAPRAQHDTPPHVARPVVLAMVQSGLLPRTGPVVVPRGWYLGVKRILDVGLALFLLVLTAPVILVACVLVKLTSRGPALYSQT